MSRKNTFCRRRYKEKTIIIENFYTKKENKILNFWAMGKESIQSEKKDDTKQFQ